MLWDLKANDGRSSLVNFIGQDSAHIGEVSFHDFFWGLFELFLLRNT